MVVVWNLYLEAFLMIANDTKVRGRWKIFTFLQEPHTSRRNRKTCLTWSRSKYWTTRRKVSTFAMEVKRSFLEMKMDHTERSHSSRAFEKP